jgi:hypothetical protein
MKRRDVYDYRKPFQQGSEILRMAAWTASPGKLKLLSLAKGQPARKEAENVATASGQPIEQIMDAVHLAARLQHIVAVCGQDALQYFLSGTCPLPIGKITILANYAAPRIKDVMERLLTGSVDVESNPNHAYDTHDFQEVISRLARARGSLTGQAEGWGDATGIKAPVPQDIPAVLETLESIHPVAGELLALVNALPLGAQPCKQSSPPRSTTSKPADHARLKASVNAAAGLIEKNLRDLRSVDRPPDLLPSGTQKQRVAGELSCILQAAELLTHSLKTWATP